MPIAVIIAVALLLATGYFVLRWGMADGYAYLAYRQMAAWEDASAVSAESWRTARDYLAQARALDEGHPVYHQRLAQLYRIRATGMSSQDSDIDLNIALQAMRESVVRRPRWAHGWAELAQLKWLANETDDEFERAIANAVRFGPWEPVVIFHVNQMQLFELSRATGEERQRIVGNAIRGLRSPTHQVSQRTMQQLQLMTFDPNFWAGEMLAYLAAPWPRAVQYNYFEILAWLWPAFEQVERAAIVTQVESTMRRLTPQDQVNWLRRVNSEALTRGLCESLADVLSTEFAEECVRRSSAQS